MTPIHVLISLGEGSPPDTYAPFSRYSARDGGEHPESAERRQEMWNDLLARLSGRLDHRPSDPITQRTVAEDIAWAILEIPDRLDGGEEEPYYRDLARQFLASTEAHDA